MRSLMEPFARIFWAALPEYKDAIGQIENEGGNERLRSELFASLKWIIKHSGPLVPPKASSAALELVGNRFDLFALQYKDQPKAEAILVNSTKAIPRNKGKLIHEHKTPVKNLYNEALNASSFQEVLTVFESQQIVWILREENELLSHINREDPEEDYARAGIEVVDNRHGWDWLNKGWK